LVRHLLRRCLQKTPNRRLHAIADARIDLEDAISKPSRPDLAVPLSDAGGRRKGMSAGVVIALAAAGVIVLGGLAAALFDEWRGAREAGTARGPQPVVFLMDTHAPKGVYDLETRINSGTNADDLNDLLRDLPVLLHKETLGSRWHREDQILKQLPDLILIHRSAFFHSFNLEVGLGYPPFDDPEHEAMVLRIYELIDSKLMAFLGYVALGDSQTKFLVYSRGRGGQWPEEDQKVWVAEAEKRFPQLEGRLFTMKVPGGSDTASFRDPKTAGMIRERVVSMLGLSEPVREQAEPPVSPP
jgi:hypothetical protein